ncbi:penicillin-binding transpeptidase domain-containing protein [Megalodesulfovibrio gigas]|uniref:penicillin-binding transpeptidase domain-containing protein n=1 Tax=Megalodesulfovibrio gigas TaxID=879 RepID=UPI00040CAEE7|nr:penicillin-binding transpeptidase domain-containing protein [Megalodesulfovibrio gigas]
MAAFWRAVGALVSVKPVKPAGSGPAGSAGRGAPPRPPGAAGHASRQDKERKSRALLSARLKLTIVACVFGVLWALLWVRAGQLQIMQGPKLAAMARRQHLASLKVAGPRGQIFDRHGLVLAKSVEFASIYCRPAEVGNPTQAATTLAKALRISRQEAYAKLSSKEPFVWVRRQVDDRLAAAVREANLPGVYLTPEYGRQYPSTILAGQLLGFVGLDDKGLSGVEQSFDEVLRGKLATVSWQRDAAGRSMSMGNDGADQLLESKGGDVRLTLDATVQMHAQEALAKAVAESKARWGGAIVIDVPTAEVLAWAEYPFFNPNAFRDAPSKLWRSGMAIDAMEMGSSIKPLVMAVALQERLVARQDRLFCEHGNWRVGRNSIRDTHPYGELSMSEIIRYSSNICTAKLGLQVGKQKLRDYFARLGFGQKVGLGLPGEAAGILRPAGAWKEIDTVTASFGQGFSVTIPQLAKAYLCLAYDGVLRPLKLIKEPALQEDSPGVRVFDPSVTWDVLSMMQEVVEQNGTGRKAKIDGVTVAGKTGTAQKARPTGGYGGEYEAVFVGLLPVENPKYLIAVVVDEPQTSHYGGVVSAPAFREIAIKTMASMGTLPEASSLLAAGSEEEPPLEMLAEGLIPMAPASGPSVRLPVTRASMEIPPPAPEPRLPREREPIAVAEGQVPDFRGASLRTAMEWFARYGVLPEIKGQGLVVSRQQPPPGSPWDVKDKNARAKCVLWLGKHGGAS